MPLKPCIAATTNLHEDDVDAILDGVDSYLPGMSQEAAVDLAIDDAIASAQAERSDLQGLINETHPDLVPAPADPVPPVPIPDDPAYSVEIITGKNGVPRAKVNIDRDLIDRDAPNFGFPADIEPLDNNDPRLEDTQKKYTIPGSQHPELEKGKRDYTPERKALHEEWIQEYLDQGAIPEEIEEEEGGGFAKPVAVLTGGGGAAGKGTILDWLREQGVIPDLGYVHVDPDEIKTENIKEYDVLLSLVDSRAAPTVHEESSDVAKIITNRAIAQGKNIIIDKTLNNREKTLKQIADLHEAGYDVRLVGVTIDLDEALIRALSRFYGSGRLPLVSHMVKAHIAFNQYFPEYAAAVESANIYDNTAGPREVMSAQGGVVSISDQILYNTTRNRGKINGESKTLREVQTVPEDNPNEVPGRLDPQAVLRRAEERARREKEAPQKLDPPSEPGEFLQRSEPISTKPAKPLERGTLQNMTATLQREFPGTRKVSFHIFKTQAEAFGSGSVKRDGLLQGGFYAGSNDMLLIEENIGSMDQAITVIRHEMIGHYGMRELLNSEGAYDRILDRVYRARSGELIDEYQWVARNYKDLVKKGDVRTIADEMMARAAETSKESTLLTRIYDQLVKLLNQFGLARGPVSRREMNSLIRLSEQNLRRKSAYIGQSMNEMDKIEYDLYLDATDEASPMSFKQWAMSARRQESESIEYDRAVAKGLDMSEKGRKARAKEQGFNVSIVYYHGTQGDFSAFQPGFKPGRDMVFVTEAGAAGEHASRIQDVPGNVVPLYIRINNTFDFREMQNNDWLTETSSLTREQKDRFTDYQKRLHSTSNPLTKEEGSERWNMQMEINKTGTKYAQELYNHLRDGERKSILAEYGTIEKAISENPNWDRKRHNTRKIGDPLLNDDQLINEIAGLRATQVYNQVFHGNWRTIEGWNEQTDAPGDTRVLDWIRAQGYDSFTAKETMPDGREVVSIGVLDTANVRSVNAAFDPDYADSSQLLARQGDQTDTPEFKAWFGESQVVDGNGAPLVVYRGQGARFNDESLLDRYFTSDREYASTYDGDSDANVLPVYLKIENPLLAADNYIHDYEWFDDRLTLMSQGYDGIHGNDRASSDSWVPLNTRLESGKYTRVKIDGVYGNITLMVDGNNVRIDRIEAKTKGRRFADKAHNLLAKIADHSGQSLNMSIAPDRGSDGAYDYLKKSARDAGFNPLEMDGEVYNAELDYTPAAQPSNEVARVKSAVGNSGAFDATNPDIRFRRLANDSPVGTALGMPEETLSERFVRLAQNSFNRIQKLQTTIVDQGGRVTGDADVYRAEELSSGKISARLRNLDQEHMKPLLDFMQESDVTLADLDQFLIAKHAQERNAYIASINDKMPDGGSGMTNAEAQEILDNAGEQRDVLEQAAARVYAVNDQNLDDLVEGGHLPQEVVDEWRSRWDYYVPLKGKAGEEGRPGTGSGYNISGAGIKKAMGRGTGNTAESPTAHTFGQAETTIVRTEKTKVGQALLQLVRDNPDPEFWTISQRQYKHFVDEFGEPFEGYDEAPTGLIENLDYKRVTNSQGNVVFKLDPNYKQRDDVFAIMQDGQEFLVQVKDPIVMEQLKKMNTTQLNAVVRGFGMVNRYLAMINTALNPEFVITNFERDFQTAMVNLGGEHSAAIAARVAKGIPGAIRGIWQSTFDTSGQSEWRTLYQEMMEEGGTIGFFGLEDIDTKVKHIQQRLIDQHGILGRTKRSITTVRDVVLDANLSVENAARLSAYKVIRDEAISNGLSVKEAKARAASVAKNLTVNFNRKGELAPVLNSAYLFYNASIQGSARIITALSNPRVRKIVAGVAATGFALAMYNRAAGGDDDDEIPYWDKISDYTKQTNLIIMHPDGSGNYSKIKLPYGYNVFFYSGAAMHDLVYNPRQSTAATSMNMLSAMMNAFNPIQGADLLDTLTPTFLKPYVQDERNANFMGAPVKPEYPFDQYDRPESQKSFKSTNPQLKEIMEIINDVTGGDMTHSGLIDISPETVKHYVGWVTGGVGLTATRTVGGAMNLASGEEVEVKDIPFIRTLGGKPGAHFDTNRYYESMKEVAAVQAQLKLLKGTDDWAEYRADNIEVSKMSVHVRRYKNRIRDLREQRDQAYAADNPDQANELREEIRGEMMKFSMLYEQAVGGQR